MQCCKCPDLLRGLFAAESFVLKLQGQFSEGDDILVLWAVKNGVNLSCSVTNLILDSKATAVICSV